MSTSKIPNQPPRNIPGLLNPTHPKINDYLNDLYFKKVNSTLDKMHEYAAKKFFPIIGPQAGLMLKTLSLSINAKRIFEFGSGFGYSAYWFMNGIHPKGEIICTDTKKNNHTLAYSFLGNLKNWKQVNYQIGSALDIFVKISGKFDIIYNDANKDAYVEIWKLAKNGLKKGGFYIADNTLWHGLVTQKSIKNDFKPGWAKTIKEHNEMIIKDNQFDSFISPIHDGVLVVRKK